MSPRRIRIIAGAIAAVVLVTPLTAGAAGAPDQRASGVCIPLLYCPSPAPAPSTPPADPADPADPVPADPSTPLDPVLPTDPDALVDPTAPVGPAPVEPAPAPVDGGAPVFTGTPASMGSESLSFTGLRGISLVTVPTVDGTGIRALKISADSITISGFSLTVRPHGGPGLVTTADTMSLQGDVTVYLGSVSASSMGGEPITIGTDTPPPLTDFEPGLLDATMGLVGTVADSITYSNTDQRIVEVE